MKSLRSAVLLPLLEANAVRKAQATLALAIELPVGVDGVIEIANPLFEGPSDKKLWPFRAITFGHVVMKLWNRNGNEPPDPAQPATAPGYNP